MLSEGHVGGSRGSVIVPSTADVDEYGAWDERSWWSV